MQPLRHMIETQEAAERGEVIQRWNPILAKWLDNPDPTWNWGVAMFRVKPKPPSPLELHVNVHPDGMCIVRESHAACLRFIGIFGARYALFREVVEPTPDPTPEPPTVEKRKPRERWINRYPCGAEYVNYSPAQAEAQADSNRIECIHVREVLEGE